MISRWMGLKQAATYMGCSVTTVKRHIELGVLNWHETPARFKRLDREQIDAMFTIPNRCLPERNRGVVTDAEERMYCRRPL